MDYSIFNFNSPVYVEDLDDSFKVRQIEDATIYFNDDYEVYFDGRNFPIASINYTKVIKKSFTFAEGEGKPEYIARLILGGTEATAIKTVRAINHLASYKSSIVVLGDYYSAKESLIKFGLISRRTEYSHRTNASIAHSYWLNYGLLKEVNKVINKLLQSPVNNISNIDLTPTELLLNGIFRRYEAYLLQHGLDVYKFKIRMAKDGHKTGRASSVSYSGMPSFFNNGKGIKGRRDYPLEQCRQYKIMKDNNLKSLSDITVYDQRNSIPHIEGAFNGKFTWNQEDLYSKMLPYTEAAKGHTMTREGQKLVVLKVNFKGADAFDKKVRDSVERFIGHNWYGTSVFMHEAFMYMFPSIEFVRRGYKFTMSFDSWEFYGSKVPTYEEWAEVLKENCDAYVNLIRFNDLSIINKYDNILPKWEHLTINQKSYINSLTTQTSAEELSVEESVSWYKFKSEVLAKGVKYGERYIARQLDFMLNTCGFKKSRFFKYFNEVSNGVYSLKDDYFDKVIDNRGNLLISEADFVNNKDYIKRYKMKLNLQSRFKLSNFALENLKKIFSMDTKVTQGSKNVQLYFLRGILEEEALNSRRFNLALNINKFSEYTHKYLNEMRELSKYNSTYIKLKNSAVPCRLGSLDCSLDSLFRLVS